MNNSRRTPPDFPGPQITFLVAGRAPRRTVRWREAWGDLSRIMAREASIRELWKDAEFLAGLPEDENPPVERKQ